MFWIKLNKKISSSTEGQMRISHLNVLPVRQRRWRQENGDKNDSIFHYPEEDKINIHIPVNI